MKAVIRIDTRRPGIRRRAPLTIRLDQIPADLMLAYTVAKGWHWAASPSDAEWAALEA